MASEEPDRCRGNGLKIRVIRGSSTPATNAKETFMSSDDLCAVPLAENRAPLILDSTGTSRLADNSAPPVGSSTANEMMPGLAPIEETPSSPNANGKSSLQQPATMPSIKPDPDSSEAAPVMDVGAGQPVEDAKPSSQDLQKEISLKSLRVAADSGDLDILEASVAAAIETLDLLRIPMEDFKQHGELGNWLARIDGLKAKAMKSGRTVVAVAGATGAGKSSLINALLDEEKLLPTNGMRACTAGVTEISYNHDTEMPYRAEVEFISREEWDSELELLFGEFLDNGQLSPAWKDPNSEAGVAYAKLKALNPNLTHEDLVKSNPRKLAEAEDVANVLGTTQEFACTSASELHSILSKYLDSKEKGTKAKTMAFWPIVRVVRIFTRADALSTNVCLVDLPGTLDSNAARSAVASKYLAECTAVWVAARIARAADDKAAKDLLGRSSRIQMKLDGAYNHLSFIATQTDGIDIRETIDTLDTDGKIQDTFSQEDELGTAITEKKAVIHNFERQMSDLEDDYDAVEQEHETWMGLDKKQKKGQKVYKPAAPSKRSRGAKRRRMVRRNLDDGSDSDDVPLTAKEIATKLEELQNAHDIKAAQCTDTERKCEAAKKELYSMQQKKADLAVERTRVCVQKRNDYSRRAIQEDFAAGIREIDEEDGQADEENYDPSVLKRDYEEVARSLPVFCISSKAYQQLRKTNRRGETKVEGFKTLEDTQIPSLQEHAKMASHKGRVRLHKVTLNQFSQLLNSLVLWTSDKDLIPRAGQVSQDVPEYEVKFLESKLGELRNSFAKAVFKLKTELLNTTRHIFGKNASSAASHASKSVGTIVTLWNQSLKDGGYGLAFGTYRATCKRGGSKTQNPKSRDFNEDILEPYMLKISGAWEQAFSQSIPVALSKFVADFMKELLAFHNLLTSRAELHKGRTASLRLLEGQLKHHEASITDVVNGVKGQLQADQREASRIFLPEIKDVMTKVYDQCAAEKGPGSFQRMKDNMLTYTQKNKKGMYKKAGLKVQKKLEQAIQTIVVDLVQECEDIRQKLADDYKLVLDSSETIEANAVVREAIREVLYQTDDKFEAILGAAQQAMDVDPAAENHTTAAVSGSVAAGPDVQDEQMAVGS